MASKGGTAFRLGLMAICALVVSLPVRALDVVIPDVNLEESLRALSVIPDSGPITDSALASITSLDLSGDGIADLTGLEYCVNLVALSINNNALTSIEPISGLTSLQDLTLDTTANGRNPLTNSSLTALSGLTNLLTLTMADVLISDLSSLANLVQLTDLDLRWSENISDLSPLSSLINLRTLRVERTAVSDITPLQDMTRLQYLNIDSTSVSDLSPLAGFQELATIDATDSLVQSVAPLYDCIALTTVQLERCHLTSLNGFQDLPNLHSVNLSSSFVTDITALGENSAFGDGDDVVDIRNLDLNQPSICFAIDAIESRGGTVSNFAASRTFNYRDCEPPVVTLSPSPTTIECGGTYTEAGATATDTRQDQPEAAPVSVAVVIGGDFVDTQTPGVYNVSYTATDPVGQSTTETRTITVVDTTPPTILLQGSAVVTVNYGDTYTDAGATASDVCEGDLTASVGTDNPVNTNQVGSYTVTYSVADSAGNQAAQVTRTVNVIDTVPPVLALLGNAAPPSIECGASYTDPGASVSDIGDNAIVATVQGAGTVDTSSPGEYFLTYNISDASGNQAEQITRKITVADTTAPTLVLNGDPSINIDCGELFVDPGYVATDACDPTVDVVVTGGINYNVAGTNQLTYTATDSAGHVTVKTRNVVVVPGGNCSTADPSAYPPDQNEDSVIDLDELLRVIQFYNSLAFHYCPGEDTEDGFCPGPDTP
jgi:hypothetical protein